MSLRADPGEVRKFNFRGLIRLQIFALAMRRSPGYVAAESAHSALRDPSTRWKLSREVA